MASVVTMADALAKKRVQRRPQHTFQLRSRPWQIQPFMIAPVLPNETLQNLLLQARCVTDPIKNPLVGWWSEYYFFYVKHRDLNQRDLLTQMVLDPDTDLSSLDAAANPLDYHNDGTARPAINWPKLCLERVTETYFRSESEAWTDGALDGLPAGKINRDDWLDSVVNDADVVVPDDVDLTSITPGEGDGTAAVKASEIDAVMRNYEFLRSNKLIDMTYEDFLATYGTRLPKQRHNIPELIRYVKDWSYPSNTVSPTDGSVASAVSWTTQERADKARYLAEPGFIFGVHVARPKVYLKGMTSNGVMMMRDAYSWLPAVLSNDPWSSMRKQTAGDAPLASNTDDYWVDIKDLLLYGDQFCNFAMSALDASIIDLPTSALLKKYASLTDAKNLFVDDTDASGLTKVRQDGVCSLTISGKQTDTSPVGTGG